MSTTEKASTPATFPGAFSLLMPSWEGVKLNIITFIELAFIPVLFSLLGSIVNHGSSTTTGTILQITADIVSAIFAPALIVTQLKSARRQTIDFSEALKTGLRFLWRLIGLTICLAVIIGIGFVLFIVPGFFMLRRYFLAPYYLVDRDMKVFDAMKTCAADSKRFSSAVWGLIGVEILFVLLSFVFIGIIFIFMYYCASAIRYNEIKSAAKRT
ncbi:MAG TPA: YciC family protein [Candidatus Saccharimonadales bacterium]|nr:YciC family protein [Candidatus Saccharimonadales bacterium]